MFERYTEKARRVIFFARYEASQLGSPYIETEHLLLGLLREDPGHLIRVIPRIDRDVLRKEIETGNKGQLKISTSVDLPLSNESKRVLAYSAEEAERLSHRHIGTEHILLGLLREEECCAARVLRQHGVRLSEARAAIGPEPFGGSRKYPPGWLSPPDTVQIHDSAWDSGYVRAAVAGWRRFVWQKQNFIGLDMAVRRSDGAISFDQTLAQDATAFDLVEGGWQEAACAICHWELRESEDNERGTGYTNGRDWLCCECYEKFMED